ncbi:tetratricopeptide repeat protein [Aneurinibacillus sp. BA2021]|nr:tetratricopeptide repeat protein [Aneurinibacillus sp. BA2021]
MAKQQYAPKKKSKIVPIQMDADFYYERAIRYLDKLNFQKALRYLRKAVELAPDNADYHCSVAGVLAELGKYEESNRFLWHVLEEVDPSLDECHFYLASNYASMMEFELAEQHILRYLRNAPDSIYAEEAEDLLDYIEIHLQDTPRLPEDEEELEKILQHDRARRLLEEGKFNEASRLLQQLVKEHPDFIAARNNLGLCYYYMGRFEKALETVHQVLQEDPTNIHGLCNLAVFYSHLEQQEKLDELLGVLKKLVPYHFDLAYKLATTLGILGEDEAAYFLFRKMIFHAGQGDIYILHYTAVAAYNTQRWDVAESLWHKVSRLDPSEQVASYYLKQIEQQREGGQAIAKASYHYQVPQFDNFSFEFLGDPAAELHQAMKSNPLLRSSLLWALRFGDKDSKLQVIQAFEHIADKEVEDALRSFLLNPAEDDYLKKVAIFVLRKMGAAEPYEAVIEEQRRNISFQMQPTLPVWQEKWQQVAECLHHHMQERYDIIEQQEAQALWVHYLRQTYPDVPLIRKQEAWAASLEYMVARRHNHAVTQEEIAARYGVSIASLSRNYRLLAAICPPSL